MEPDYNSITIRGALVIYNQEKPLLSTIRTEARSHFFTYLRAQLWYSLRILLGIILLIIPGIYIRIRYFFTGFSILEKRTSTVFEDKNFVYALNKNAFWQIFLFALVITLVVLLPQILFNTSGLPMLMLLASAIKYFCIYASSSVSRSTCV